MNNCIYFLLFKLDIEWFSIRNVHCEVCHIYFDTILRTYFNEKKHGRKKVG